MPSQAAATSVSKTLPGAIAPKKTVACARDTIIFSILSPVFNIPAPAKTLRPLYSLAKLYAEPPYVYSVFEHLIVLG